MQPPLVVIMPIFNPQDSSALQLYWILTQVGIRKFYYKGFARVPSSGHKAPKYNTRWQLLDIGQDTEKLTVTSGCQQYWD